MPDVTTWFGVPIPTLTAAFITAITLFALIFGRFELRLRRLRMIRDYIRTFPNTTNADDQTTVNGVNPSFELVRTKYSAGVRKSNRSELLASAENLPNSVQGIISDISDTISKTRIFGNYGDLWLGLAAVPYVLVVFFGFSLTLGSPGCFAPESACFHAIAHNMLTVGGMPASTSGMNEQAATWMAQNAATIAAITFVGAYVASLRYLIQALAIFDLSGYTLIRQAAMILISMLVVTILYRMTPENPSNLGEIIGTASVDQSGNGGVSPLWMLLALAFGLLPGSALRFVMTKASPYLPFFKQTDDRFTKWTAVVPLDAIDGIDYFTRFRLEECGIADVQALATYNPIMLHIESPFSIYQVIDWIAQAQLCSVVGLDRFLLLRHLNVRTIFDLERSLMGKDPETDKKRAIDQFDLIYAAILFAPNAMLRGIQKTSQAKFLIPVNKQIREVDASEFSCWALEMISADDRMASRAIEHLMRWIGDDLHVRRLRRLLNEISTRLGALSIDLVPDDTIRAQNRLLHQAAE